MSNVSNKASEIFHMFFDGTPSSVIVNCNSSIDFRVTMIFTVKNGGKVVVKLADNEFTTPARIKVWEMTTRKYKEHGCFCPAIICSKNGDYPYITYRRHKCVAYAEEYAPYDTLDIAIKNHIIHDERAVYDDVWAITARIASEKYDFCDFPSAYCLYGKFAKDDECNEVDEHALDWKNASYKLPSEFKPQIEKIWNLWKNNRTELEKTYFQLPVSVFQGDLNESNILVDKNGKFAGIIDFNLCGTEELINYIIRESPRYDEFDKEKEGIFHILKTVAKHYTFSDAEKDAILMIYRSIKPIWVDCEIFESYDAEKNEDNKKMHKFLDDTEKQLTEDIDFSPYMTV